MTYFDWLKPSVDTHEHSARLDVLVSCDVLKILKRDPRDEIFETLLYWHPEPVPTRAQIDGVFDVGPLLAQLVISDMIAAGLVHRSATGNLQISDAGLAFAAARLIGPDVNSLYRVKEGAPSYSPLGEAPSIAIKNLILTSDPIAKYLIKDIYHPALGRATFD
jgi:hypothetical protein